MRYFIALSMLVVGLVATATATAGGWATVQLASLPTGLDSGETWNARMTVLRHARTPTDGAEPILTIRNDATGQSQSFSAEPTGETGVYEAAVVFPAAGTWSYEIDNGLEATGYGMSETSTYAPVTIGSRAGAPSSFPVAPVLLVLGPIALVAAAAFGVVRQRRLTPAS